MNCNTKYVKYTSKILDTLPMFCIKIGSIEILTVRHLKYLLLQTNIILFYMVDRIFKQTSNIQTKPAENKH